MYKVGLLKQVKKHIKSGGVIAYPTEYCFGLGVDPRNYKAINKIFKLKARNKNKGLIVIAGRFYYLKPLIASLAEQDMKYVNNYWPGNYSFIVSSSKTLARNLIGKNNSLAVRVSKHKLVKQLSDFLQLALVSTSANKSACMPVRTYRECQRLFGGCGIMVLPGTTLFTNKPSTIINLKSHSIIR